MMRGARVLSTSTAVKTQPNLEAIKSFLIPGRGFVGPNPFPTNPFFKPASPVAEDSRRQIYDKYTLDPSNNNPRVLAEQFGVSIVRIEAILRLKALEAKFIEDDKPIQTKLTKGMERMLGNVRLSQNRIEPIRETIIQGMHPFIQLVDEEIDQDAAKLLAREPFENIQRRLDLKAEKVYEDNTLESGPQKLESNPILGGKFEFMFVDTSTSLENGVSVRDRDGRFRKASRQEIWKLRENKIQKYQM